MNSLKTTIDKKKINKEVNKLSKGMYYCCKVIFLLSSSIIICLFSVFISDWASMEMKLYCIIAFCMMMLFNGFIVYGKYKAISILKKKITNMYKRGRGFCVEGIISNLEVNSRQAMVIYNDCIFLRPNIIADFQDIVWIYKNVEETQFYHMTIYKKNRFIIYTAYGEVGEIQGGEKEIIRLINDIAQYNPMILVGYTKENKRMYKRMVKKNVNRL